MKYNIDMNKIKKVVAGGLAGLVLGLTSPAYAKDNSCHKWKFDNQTIEVCMYDGNADGIIDSISRTEYDHNGKEIKKSFDIDFDGKMDLVWTSEYDQNGRLIKESFDTDGNGKIDSIMTYEYNNGKINKNSWDKNADGIVDSVITFGYD